MPQVNGGGSSPQDSIAWKDEKVFNFIGIARDVTEQKQAEEKVQQAAQEG